MAFLIMQNENVIVLIRLVYLKFDLNFVSCIDKKNNFKIK